MSDAAVPTDGELFKTVERESTLTTRVTAEIEHLIVGGQLQPGKRLPSERELADQFGVSRTVVREAVRGLVAMGLLEVRPGSGTIIRSPSARSVTQSMSLFLRSGQAVLDHTKVHEVRRVLEIEIAGMAAERRTDEDLARLHLILDEMEAIVKPPQIVSSERDHYAANDVAFHSALAQATHNELFSLLLDSVVDVMIKVRQMGFDVPGSLLQALAFHRAILAQVEAGDAAGAREAMRVHLIDSEDVMRQGLALRAARQAE
ncbi:MAG: FadR family transcriptional regulator [Chloroflexota bacterium]|nr:FadR family transcriptional regulator [Chloroflexota bacterium]